MPGHGVGLGGTGVGVGLAGGRVGWSVGVGDGFGFSVGVAVAWITRAGCVGIGVGAMLVVDTFLVVLVTGEFGVLCAELADTSNVKSATPVPTSIPILGRRDVDGVHPCPATICCGCRVYESALRIR
jgi:hypothetical protein